MVVDNRKPLSKKQKVVLDFIVTYIKEHDIAPSIKEIGDFLGVSSPATVHEHLSALVNKGYLKKDFNEKRSLRLTSKSQGFAKAIVLPLSGLIAAGEPIEALEENETIAVPSDLVMSAINSYVLRVKGDSMTEEGIFDGDYVIVERNPSPKNGNIVVALLDNAYATLKKFFRERNRIRLEPANSRLKPIYVKDPLIQGIVKGIIRKLT